MNNHGRADLPVLLSTLLVMILMLSHQPLQAQIGWAEPFEDAVVVTAEEQATKAGMEILERGGNAVDAAVAVQFALAVTLPRAGNIGGGGFMVVHLEDGTVAALDFREKAPASAYRDMYLDDDGNYVSEWSRRGALASGVPGVVDGMIQALERYGSLSIEEVLEPAIRLAGEGFPLSWMLARELNNAASSLSQFESSKAYFLREDGREWERGDLFVQEDLAATLERIANDGRDGFYSGETARMIVEEMERHDGMIDYDDLADYRAAWREPVQARIGDYTLHMMSPPSSGGLVIQQVLGMLRGYDLYEKGFNSSDYIHLISEALRRSFADRNYYFGDPDFVDIPTNEFTNSLYLSRRMRDFRPHRATNSEMITEGILYPMPESDETTHFSILDGDGNGVAITTTLNGSFGSMLSVSGAGFLLNNEMDDFSAAPGEPNMFGLIGAEANAIEPGKRMLSSMTPTIVSRDGDVRMILGAAGGPRIITSTLQVILNLAVFDMNAREAMNANRFHHQWLPDRLTVEQYTLSADTEERLAGKGHEIHHMGNVGRVQLIYVDDEGLRYGVPDPRGDGFSIGR